MARIAFVSSIEYPMSDDDALAAAILRSEGCIVESPAWDDPSAEWDGYDLVVIRSAWNYHRCVDEYAAWLGRFDGRLWNPAALVRANLDKRYLLSMADVVPTVLGEGSLADILQRHGWSEAVVKPTVSAGAEGTWRATAADEERFAEQSKRQALLVQPFMPEVVEKGEWSLVYFDGEYSHAVLKRPGAGDFRVQQHHGGTTVAATPPTGLIEQGRRLVEGTLYARVDGVERGGRLLLMELEINEPFLFLGYDAGAPRRFAEAILAKSRLVSGVE